MLFRSLLSAVDTLTARAQALEQSNQELAQELHDAINEQMYAGTRKDWQRRAWAAEARVQELEQQVAHERDLNRRLMGDEESAYQRAEAAEAKVAQLQQKYAEEYGIVVRVWRALALTEDERIRFIPVDERVRDLRIKIAHLEQRVSHFTCVPVEEHTRVLKQVKALTQDLAHVETQLKDSDTLVRLREQRCDELEQERDRRTDWDAGVVALLRVFEPGVSSRIPPPTEAISGIAKLQAELTRLQTALARYGRHDENCRVTMPLCKICGHASPWLDHSVGFTKAGHHFEPEDEAVCTCGLDKALTRAGTQRSDRKASCRERV